MAVTCMAPGVVIDAHVYHIRLHGGQMTKTTWFDDLELLSRRCAWERGERILFQPPPGPATWTLLSPQMISPVERDHRFSASSMAVG